MRVTLRHSPFATSPLHAGLPDLDVSATEQLLDLIQSHGWWDAGQTGTPVPWSELQKECPSFVAAPLVDASP